MQRPRIQPPTRPSRRLDSLTPAVLLGLGVGVAAGFLLGELLGGRSGGALKRLLPQGGRGATDAKRSTPITRVRNAIAAEASLAGLGLEAVPAGRHAVELHGWVPSRSHRARALRLSSGAAGSEIRIVDCLLVQGEDDTPPSATGAARQEPRSA